MDTEGEELFPDGEGKSAALEEVMFAAASPEGEAEGEDDTTALADSTESLLPLALSEGLGVTFGIGWWTLVAG